MTGKLCDPIPTSSATLHVSSGDRGRVACQWRTAVARLLFLGLFIHSFILFCSSSQQSQAVYNSHWAGHEGYKAPTTAHRGLRNLSYCDRLIKLGLCTLELRRLHLDLLYCYKIVFGLVNVNFDDFFALSTNTRGHKYKLFKPRCTASIRQKFFVDRVINVWNALPSTTNFASLNVF